MSFSFSFHFHCHFICPAVAGRVCVCVCHLYRCKNFILLQGAAGEHCSQRPMKTLAMFLCKRTCFIYIYVCIVPPLGAYKSPAGGTYILSLLFYTINVYCDYTSIYNCINVHSSCHFIVGVFARQMHSTSEFAKTVLSKCVYVAVAEILDTCICIVSNSSLGSLKHSRHSQ